MMARVEKCTASLLLWLSLSSILLCVMGQAFAKPATEPQLLEQRSKFFDFADVGRTAYQAFLNASLWSN